MDRIKRYWLVITGVLLLSGVLLVGGVMAAQSGPGGTGSGVTGGAGSASGGGGMMGGAGSASGGGMMGGSATATGAGMMGGAGSTSGAGMMGGYSAQSNPPGPRLSGARVQQAVTDYVGAYYKGQDLVIAEIMEFENNFYAQIQEQATGINAFELLIDPYAGNVWPEYGPNMMWNTKYGMMGQGMMGTGRGMMGGTTQRTLPTANMPVNAQQAVQAAQAYLDAQGTGLTAEDQPDLFYGYYTIHTLKDSKIAGMLSVNGYTGQVVYHSWHGAFIGMVGNPRD